MKGKFVMGNNSNNSGGIGFWGMLVILLTVLFVGLKLGEVGYIATLSWWWVLSPLWISFGIGLVFVVITLIIAALIMLAKNSK